MKNKRLFNRFKWGALIITLLLSSTLSILAYDSKPAQVSSGEIIYFETLDEAVLNQIVPFGTEESDLNLPPKVSAVVLSDEVTEHNDLIASGNLSLLFGPVVVWAADAGNGTVTESENQSPAAAAEGEDNKYAPGESEAATVTEGGDGQSVLNESEAKAAAGTVTESENNQSTLSESEAAASTVTEGEDDQSTFNESEAEASVVTEGEGDQSALNENEAEAVVLPEGEDGQDTPEKTEGGAETVAAAEGDDSHGTPAESGDSQDTLAESESEDEAIVETEAEDEQNVTDENDYTEPLPDSSSQLQQVTAYVDVVWSAEPEFDGTTAGTYVFTAQPSEDFTLSPEAVLPQITVMVMPEVKLLQSVPVIRVTNREQLLRVFSHGAASGGDLGWSGERIVEMAFEQLGGVIDTNITSTAPAGTSRVVTLRSADGVQRNITTVTTFLSAEHFYVGNRTTLIIDDPNLHIVGSNADKNISGTEGGGIRVNNGGVFELADGTIRNIYPTLLNSAVNVNIGGTFIMSGGFVQDNRSSSGGGVRVFGPGARFDMYGGTIINNTAFGDRGGGGVLALGEGALFNMYDGIIEGNTVTSDWRFPYGGGVSAFEGATFNMNGGTISRNTARRGGGVAAWEGIFNLGTGRTEVGRAPAGQGGVVGNPLITGNTAIAGGFESEGLVIGIGGGGGVFVYGSNNNRNNVNFAMHAGTISYNNSTYRGGGVFLNSAGFDFRGGEIIGNETTDNGSPNSGGGGVYMHSGLPDFYPAVFNMSGGSIRNNKSRNGGGVARGDNRLPINITGNSVIAGNVAQLLGGGICTGSPASGSIINTASVEQNRNNLTIAATVKFEQNRGDLINSRGLKVAEVRANSANMYNNIQWSGKNSANGRRSNDDDFHLFNNHDICNLQGIPIIHVDMVEKPPNDPILAISKSVTTDNTTGYDFVNREMYFDFKVMVVKSGTNPDTTQKYKAYVLDESGNVVTDVNNYFGDILTDPKYGDYIELTTGKQADIRLKHGQWLSFVNLEVGAAYTVTELAKEKFTPGCNQIVNGVMTTISGELDASLTVPSTEITAGSDRADFINTYMTIVPVGIGLNDLPYIMLIGLGLAALAVFAAVNTNIRLKSH